jgi:hypothetical protein
MAIVNKIIENVRTDVITVPAGKSYAVTNILVCNQGATDVAFDMHLLPSGGGGFDTALNRVINNLVLPSTETFSFDSERIVLEAGDIVAFKGTPGNGTATRGSDEYTNLSATLSYLEV